MDRRTAKADVAPTSGVYRVWCSDEHYYLGRSSNIEGRCAGHVRKLRQGGHINPHMQAVFNKHGAFRYEVFEVAGATASTRIEQSLIDKHLSDPLCMNICASAEIPTRKGLRNSPEHCAAISRSRMGQKATPAAKANMSEGQRRRFEDGWSPELRGAMMATRNTPEYRAKISAAHKGRTLSEDHKAKIGDALRGRAKSDETRAKLSESLKGRTFSEGTRAKIATAATGRKASEETKAKMRAAQAYRRAREQTAQGNSHV